VPETPVGADLLEALEVLAELRVDAVGQDLVVLAVDNVALAVEEPRGDLVLGRVLEDRDDALELFRGELSGTVFWKEFVRTIVFPFFVFSTSVFCDAADGMICTVCSSRHRPSCRRGWSNDDRHP